MSSDVNIESDFSARLRSLRERLGFTQAGMAQTLGVSFASVNRWENGQRPSSMAWDLLRRAEERFGAGAAAAKPQLAAADVVLPLDFVARPERVRLVAEAERLSFGHLANPTFATEVSLVDPLPHQRLAVYEHMLKQPRLRFLLADDAGAGKTIMTGLYVREMLARRLIRRVLIVPPAGLVGNWEKELRTLFSLEFRIVRGQAAREGNPFVGPASDRVICSLDTIDQGKPFARLREEGVEPYDLVVFDEAHKLAADQDPDLTIRTSDRYKFAEAVAGVADVDPEWSLPWTAHHLLLLTATPHMGKEYPYFALWRLLEPEILPTLDAFQRFPPEKRAGHFLRRAKEEMVRLDGTPLYPPRQMDTWSFDLEQGPESEQALYDAMTAYMKEGYNRAAILSRSAARLAMGVLQRRLASSTYALLRSLERRAERLDDITERVRRGELTPRELRAAQKRLDEGLSDPLEEGTADDDASEDPADAGTEAHERAEDKLLGAVVETSIEELQEERRQVDGLVTLARAVFTRDADSKFRRLCELLRDPRYRDEKVIVFTEHRDTLVRLTQRLEGMGFTEKVASIHGGMEYPDRDRQVEWFRRPHDLDGAQYLIATDAAGEGINLQFCWLMVNYDVPWNPARLEQRLGRIHRYGQSHDHVQVVNLLAGKTREGRVLAVLLEKLEKIRAELGSDKVFDVVGRLFENVRIPDLMADSLTDEGMARSTADIEGRLTPEQVTALEARQRLVYGEGGDVKRELPRLRAQSEGDVFRRLLPGFVREFVERAADELALTIDGDLDSVFALRAGRTGSLDALLPALEALPPEFRGRLTVERPHPRGAAYYLHPGEPVFEALRSAVLSRFAVDALRGGAFVDPTATEPYMFHLAEVEVVRRADPARSQPESDEVVECRLVGLRHGSTDLEGLPPAMEVCAVEQLLLLRGLDTYPAEHTRFAGTAQEAAVQGEEFLSTVVAARWAAERRRILADTLPERERFVRFAFDSRDAELAASRVRLSEKARGGDASASARLSLVKQRQKELFSRLDAALEALRVEPSRIAVGRIRFVAHALVVPTRDPEERRRHDADVEAIAIRVTRAYEEAQGAVVRDVSTPPKARAAGLGDHPGFDLLSTRADGTKRAIEVKGRAGLEPIEVTANEWARACTMREEYWLYGVYDCGSAAPRLSRVQDPFGKLIAASKGSLLISAGDVLRNGECGVEPAPTEEPLPESLRPLFWEYRFEDLRWPSSRELVIGRVLAAGGEAAHVWLRRLVSAADLFTWIAEHAGAGMDPRRLRYWQNLLGLPEAMVDRWVERARSGPWGGGDA